MPATRGPKAKSDKTEKTEGVDKTEKFGSKKQKNKKDIEGGEMVESEKGEGVASGGGTEVGGVSGTELMSVKHTDLPHCVDCGKKVLWTHAALLCDSCGFWHHATCEKVDDEVYNFLSEHSAEQTLLWYCKKCAVTSRKLTAAITAMTEQQHQLEVKINTLTSNIQLKIEEVVCAMMNKVQSQLNGDQQSNNDKDAIIEKKIEEKVDALIDTVTNKFDIQSSVGEAVASKLNEEKDEEDEIRRRRLNIIVHGVQESNCDTAEKRMKEDENEIMDLLHDMGCDNVSVSNTIRLGKRKDKSSSGDTDTKSSGAAIASPTTEESGLAKKEQPRPLMLVMASEEQKEKMLKMTKNLRNRMRWKNIFLHQDLTPKQRERRHQLVGELKRRQQDGEKDLIIIGNRIVTRRIKAK